MSPTRKTSPKSQSARPAGQSRSPKKGPAASRRKGKAKVPTAAQRATAKTETGAGGIVFKRTPRGVRLALIRDPYGKWTFAKGHQEPNESLRQTALRETREEMGLGRLKVIRKLGRIDFWFKDSYRAESKGQVIHKFVHYFLMEAPSGAKGQPQKKEKISRLTWVTANRVRKMNGYRDTKDILERALKELGDRGLAKKKGPASAGNKAKTTGKPKSS